MRVTVCVHAYLSLGGLNFSLIPSCDGIWASLYNFKCLFEGYTPEMERKEHIESCIKLAFMSTPGMCHGACSPTHGRALFRNRDRDELTGTHWMK